MAKRFGELRDALPPESRARARARTKQLLREMRLQELRSAKRLSQEQIARTLGLKQSNVSKLEKRTDMFISTLRRFLEAMGAELEITARFSDEEVVRITQFEDLDRDARSADDEAVAP